MWTRLGPWLSLFASMGTLMCCAIPSLLVVLGMGTTLAGFIGFFPQVVLFSQYKLYVFLISGLFILLASFLNYYNRQVLCSVDPSLAMACRKTRAWSSIVLIISALLWGLGAFFAFVAPQLF